MPYGPRVDRLLRVFKGRIEDLIDDLNKEDKLYFFNDLSGWCKEQEQDICYED